MELLVGGPQTGGEPSEKDHGAEDVGELDRGPWEEQRRVDVHGAPPFGGLEGADAPEGHREEGERGRHGEEGVPAGVPEEEPLRGQEEREDRPGDDREAYDAHRSEERRVGEEGRSRW